MNWESDQTTRLDWGKFLCHKSRYWKIRKKQLQHWIIVYTTTDNDILKVTSLWITKRTGVKEIILFVYESNIQPMTNNWVLLCKQLDAKNKVLFCRRFGYITTEKKDENSCVVEDQLEIHNRYCDLRSDYCGETFPKPDKNLLEFKRWDTIARHPIMIAVDFECITKPIWEKRGKKTVRYQKHEPSGFGLHVMRFNRKNSYYSHTGSDASTVFAEKLDKITQD